MIDRLRAATRRLGKSPGWQLVVGGLVLALAFPSRLSGAVGMMILAGGVGVAMVLAWPKLPAWLRHPPEQVTGTLVVTLVVAMGLSTFWDTMMVSPDWQMGDWGPQRAVLQSVMDSLPGLDTPVWNHAVSTGDAPLELYPQLAYLVTGHTALALGLADDLPRAMMIVAVLTHIGIAAATTTMAMRVAPKPIAFVVGAMTVVESGAVAHGGTVGLFRWALLHSAMALAFATIAALGVLAALRRPRLSASIAIWIGSALATAAHPAGLIAMTAMVLALAGVALLAHDVPPRRALVAIAHVTLGVALAAAVWMPLAERILAYGQHFPNALRSPAALLEDLLQAPSPVSAFAIMEYAGYFGIIAGLWSRRALPVFLSVTALVLLVGLCDAPYLALDLAPGQGVARLGTERLAQLARPFLAAAGAFGISIFVREAMRGWSAVTQRRKLVAAAIAAVLAASVIRVIPAVWASASSRAYTESIVFAPDPEGRRELTAWARQRAAELRPDAWARAVVETDTHEHFHLTAATGLPTFHLAPQPDLLLRERIEDLSAASLRRFNVRWIMADGHSPSAGDEATERVFGTWHVRELPDWDGQFARIERGSGTVKTLALDNRHVEIEVTATEPVLVALGTGYYPRWRATHASGAAEPVYAYPTIPGGKLHVVSAWVAPGRTTFTVDGPLPSDGKGRPFTILALVIIVAAIVTWSVRRFRVRVLRRLAILHRKTPALAKVAAQVGVPLALVLLLARGCVDRAGPTKALELGSGLRAEATVEARLTDGDWETCGYSAVTATYSCDQLLVAYDGMAALLNDAAPSWGFNTPAIVASAHRDSVEMRIRLRARLDGTYWAAASDTASFKVQNASPRAIDREILVYSDDDARTIEIRAAVPTTTWQFTMVREDTIVPPRPFLAGPPATAPREVSGIGDGLH